MTDDELVDAFGTAALRAGHGYGVPAAGGSPREDWWVMQAWRAALKDRVARLRAQAREKVEVGS